MTLRSFFPSFRLTSNPPSQCSRSNFVLDDCKSSYTELLQGTTEFLLIGFGVSKQLAKINNSSLTTTHCARNIGFIFNEHLPFLTRSHLSPNLAITIFVSFAVSVHTSTDPELSCTCCCQSSQIQSHHSHPSVSG